MAKVDTVIAAAGIALLVFAAGGLLWAQEFADLQDHEFTLREVPLEGQQKPIVSGTKESLEWHGLPPNATGATLQLTITYTGQAVQGGTATVDMELVGPDGTLERETATFAVAPGASSGQAVFPLSVTWGSVPGPLRGQSDDLPEARDAEGPLRLSVAVQGPADVPLVAGLDFTLAAEGTIQSYTAQAV